MEKDYGARILAGGLLTAPANAAYNFGTGDFTVTALFETTQPGTLAARKSTAGGGGDGGWLVVLEPNGRIKFATDNGFGFYQVTSDPTDALDGTWHSVAAVRRNGAMTIYFDAKPVPVQASSSTPTPTNVSNSQRLTIGGCDQVEEPYRQFVGILEDVSLWNRALGAQDIWRTMFNKVTPQDPGLVGLWEMNQSPADSSLTRNNASASGPVGWAPVMHCLWAEAANTYSYLAIDMHETAAEDYGAQIAAGGLIAIPSNPAYQFGLGDFSITCLFKTSAGGGLVTSKAPQGGSPAYAGWLLALNADSTFTLATDNGYSYYLINSVPTAALDGQWHSIAAVRAAGVITLWFDGVAIRGTPMSTAPSPLNVSSNRRVVIGQLDQAPLQFTGVIEDVTIWNRAIGADLVQAARFNAIDPTSPGLVGYWKMDRDFVDASPTHNTGAAVGAVTFVPVAHLARRRQKLNVAAGTAYLYGGVLDQSQVTVAFPRDVVVAVTRPDGTVLNQSVSTPQLAVQMNGASVWAFVVKDPMAGDWTFQVDAPTGSAVLLSVQTTPSQDIAGTIETALTPLYSGGDSTRRSLRRAAAEAEVLAVDWTWADVAAFAGMTMTTVAAVIVGGAVVTGAVLSAPVVLTCAVAVGVGSLVANLGLAAQVEQGAYQVASGIGLPVPALGGSAQGSVALQLDGRDYFPALRDLLLAVQYGHYDPAGISVPNGPTVQKILTNIGGAGKQVSFLLWDTNDAEHLAQNNYYISTYLRTRVVPNWDKNVATRAAFAGVANVDVRLESYHVYASQRWFNSQHQKIAIVRVNGVKCALVGGFNLLWSYWDTVTHPTVGGASWHDAAVVVSGPVVDVIEAEFDRRWAKVGGAVSGPGDYAKLAFWAAAHDMCLDDPVTCSTGGPTTIPYANRLIGGPQYPVDVLITNAEFARRVTQVRDKMIEKINAATAWAYLENFTFHDPAVVRALIAKLAAAPAFNVVVLIPHPLNTNGLLNAGEISLSRAALAAIMLAGSEWVQMTYDLGAGPVTVTLAACRGAPVVNLPDGVPIELGTFSYVLALDGSQHTVGLLKITDIVQTSTARTIAASPARYVSSPPLPPSRQLPGLAPGFRGVYVHSKLALFDANYAIVGSANLNSRSLASDGECSIGVSDPTTVAQIRQSVQGHWGVDPATQNWKAAMAAFVASPTDRLGVVPLTISAMAGAQPSGDLWSAITFFVDPSFIL